MPYLVGLAQEAHDTGLTPVRPLVFRWPDETEAGDAWDEWLLGDDLLVAPVWRSGTAPARSGSRRAGGSTCGTRRR